MRVCAREKVSEKESKTRTPVNRVEGTVLDAGVFRFSGRHPKRFRVLTFRIRTTAAHGRSCVGILGSIVIPFHRAAVINSVFVRRVRVFVVFTFRHAVFGSPCFEEEMSKYNHKPQRLATRISFTCFYAAAKCSSPTTKQNDKRSTLCSKIYTFRSASSIRELRCLEMTLVVVAMSL